MKITYYLGAGASANALPVITEIEERLKVFESAVRKNGTSPARIRRPTDPDLGKEIEWLLSELAKHQTIDTLAKKFFLINEPESLLRLKKVLIAYFLFEQSYIAPKNERKHETLDKRYDAFIATLVGNKMGKVNMPNNLKIITWNYDLQFELTYKEYRPGKRVFEIQQELQSIPRHVQGRLKFALENFGIVRLNGIIGIGSTYREEAATITTFFDRHTQNATIDDIIDYFTSIDEKLPGGFLNTETSYLNFSWEDDPKFGGVNSQFEDCRDVAGLIMEQTEILVIIGYSFPIFNMDVDRLILSRTGPIKRVYIQSLEPEIIKERFLNLFPREKIPQEYIVPIDSTSQFFLPMQLLQGT